ncbi:MAG: aldo/keto reductase, partial [Aggregatilineales bacterium]
MTAPAMIYRPFGNTGLDVSILSFGAATLGNVYGNLTDQDATRVVSYAMDQGINYFDTSPYYGDTLSETRLGNALRGHREKVILGTKGGHCPASAQKDFDFSAQGLRQSLNDSLKRLQTDYVDIYLLHDVEFEEREVIIHEALPELYRLREQGKIRFVGISGYPLQNLQKIAEICLVDVILSYSHYTLLNTTLMNSLVPFAQSNNIALINASPLDMGLLTDQGPPAWHKIPDNVRVAVAKAIEVSRLHNTTLSRVALQFALNNDAIATTLIGMQ